MILLITTEKYVAIVYPYNHKRLITRKNIVTSFCLASIATAVLVTSTRMLLPKTKWVGQLVLMIMSTVAFVFIAYMYVRIIHVVRRITHDIARTNPEEAMMIKEQGRALKTSAIILVAFAVCYIPTAVKIAINWAGMTSPFHFREWCNILAFSNPLLDAVIYFLNMDAIRQAAMRCLKGKKKTSDEAYELRQVNTNYCSVTDSK